MVTNSGHPIFLNYDRVISNEQVFQYRQAPGTIVTPKHLNENRISVYFANGTTVLLMADTIELYGTVIHQKTFPEGLTLFELCDQCVGDKTLLNTTPLIPLLVVTCAPPLTIGVANSSEKLSLIILHLLPLLLVPR
jgi:hypothetical protein